MAFTTQDFTTLVRNQVAAIQAATSVLVDLTIGSILRAVVEANAAVVLWLQGLILQLLAITRAATSGGADLDSWVGDFGLTRLAATYSTGLVTFARFTATQQAVVPVGATVQSSDGSQTYAVTLDTTNPAYSAALGGYVLSAGVASINVPLQALVGGIAGNAVAGGINTLGQAISGVDTVTNAAAFTNGSDAETDAALRIRFIAWVASLSKATKGAIGYAITSLKQGITFTRVENQQYNGATDYGYFYVVIDDGTGAPSSGLLSAVASAIEAVRGFTIRYGVFAPVISTANVSMTITTGSGYVHSDVVALVIVALQSYINALPRDAATQIQTLPLSRLAQVAYDASPGVTNVTGVTINGGTSDITADAQHVIKAGTLGVA